MTVADAGQIEAASEVLAEFAIRAGDPGGAEPVADRAGDWRCGPADRRAARLDERGIRLDDVGLRRPTLDEVFLDPDRPPG